MNRKNNKNLDSNFHESKKKDFIRESILEDGKSKHNRMRNMMFAILYGILFGLAASIVFVLVEPHVRKNLGEEESQRESEAETKRTVVDEHNKDVIYDDITMAVEKAVKDYGLDIKECKSELEVIKNVGQAAEHSMATIIVSDSENWLDENAKQKVTSGIIVQADSDKGVLVLTDYDSVSEYSNRFVYLYNGKGYKASVKSSSKHVGVAILKVDGSILTDQSLKDLNVINIAKIHESSYEATIGEPSIIIGNPYGTSRFLSYGKITSVNNPYNDYDVCQDIITTDICNNGLSDGFLIDLEGNVLGMISRRGSNEAMKDIVSVTSLKKISGYILELMKGSKIAYLGIKGETVTDDIRQVVDKDMPDGVIITGLEIGSPAEDAALMSGDILIRINELDVQSVEEFMDIMSKYQEKDNNAQLSVMRKGKEGYKQIDYKVRFELR